MSKEIKTSRQVDMVVMPADELDRRIREAVAEELAKRPPVQVVPQPYPVYPSYPYRWQGPYWTRPTYVPISTTNATMRAPTHRPDEPYTYVSGTTISTNNAFVRNAAWSPTAGAPGDAADQPW